MTNELFIKIIGAVITIIVAIITGVVIPMIKAKLNQTQLEKLDYYLNLAVRCANQIFTPEQWEAKKKYVTCYITDKVNNVLKLSLNAEDIDVLIEGCVNQIKGEK